MDTMHVTAVIRARRVSELVRISLDGLRTEYEDAHAKLDFEVYLDGVLIGSGSSRDELDKALGALREIMDDELLKELGSSLVELAFQAEPSELIARSGRAGIMLCEAAEYDRRGEKAFVYASDFLLDRQPKP